MWSVIVNPLVSILMPTYNHERFIKQAIESALSQKCDYSYELLINDDCSTDNTLKIAKEYEERYPDKIKVFTHEKNQGLLKSYKYLLQQAQGKYIAVLESDDVWSNENKLQIQISFLEEHDDYGLVCSDYYTIDENSVKQSDVIKDFDKNQNDEWYDALMGFASIGALTIIFRKSEYDKYCNIDDFINLKFQTFDRGVWLSIAKHCKCHYFHEQLAAYRVISSSISNSGNFEKAYSFAKSVMDIHEYVISKYGLGKISRKEFDQKKIIWYVNLCITHRNFGEFKKLSRQLQVTNLKYFAMKYFTRLWWLQYTLRNPQPKHLSN